MSRAEMRRQKKMMEKENKKISIPAPMNVTNYTLEQISNASGVRIGLIKKWLKAREEEIFERLLKEAQEKVLKAEDYIAVGNVLISLFAIQETWGFKKSNQKFVENLNVAKTKVEQLGVIGAYQLAKKEMGVEFEFEDIDLNKEFKFGEYDHD